MGTQGIWPMTTASDGLTPAQIRARTPKGISLNFAYHFPSMRALVPEWFLDWSWGSGMASTHISLRVFGFGVGCILHGVRLFKSVDL
jgi:hypothetical protein